LVDLFLFRHGIAEPRCHRIDDSERALTAQGLKRTLEVAKHLQGLGFAADQLFTSPYRRARETAELAIQAGLAQQLVLADSLAPGRDPWPLLLGLSERCLLVGHEPDLSVLAARLLGATPGCLSLKKAGFVHLRWPPDLQDPAGHAELQALLRPSLLLPRSA